MSSRPPLPASVVLVRLAAWLAAVPYVLIVVLVMTGPPTWSGAAYLAGIGVLLWGLMTLPGRSHPERALGRPRGLARGAALSLVAIALVRGCTGRSGETLSTLPEPRWTARLVDEQDIALAGTRVLVAGGLLRDDRNELTESMRSSYRQMRAEEGDAPSPVLTTYLGMQSPDAFDLLLVDPRSDRSAPARDAVIFLHGFAGGFALPCWQMARAVAPLDVVTACPSTRWTGDWWSSQGEATLRLTVDALRARGASRIVLAGLSNGGYGASRLAPRMRGTFVGVVLLSGAAADAGQTGVPVLLVHGRHDTMAGFGEATAYASSHPNARVVALDAGHFAMLVRATENDHAVREFVGRVLERPSRSSARL